MVMTQKDRAAVASGLSGEAREGGEVEHTEVRVTSRKVAPPSSLQLMLAQAQVVIAHMAPADPRARLLQVAMLRRDEILLEALLRRLNSAPSR
jgi:hypothetical protein